MAITTISSSSNLAAKLWSKVLFRDVLKKTYFNKFMGKGSSAIIQILDDAQKRKGDKITYGLRVQLSGDGRTGQQTLEGNEEDLTFYDDSLYIDLMRHAVKSDMTISQQRLEYDLRMEGKDALSDWWANRIDDYMFRYLGGDTSLTFAGNTATAPDSSHVVYASTATADSQLTTAMKFTLDLIDKSVEKAKTVSPGIRPVRIEGEEYYVCVLHPYQVYDIRTSTSTGQWLDIQKQAMAGGKVRENPIFTGALGIYNGTILYESNRIALFTGVGATTYCRAACFMGAQAGVVAFGSGNGQDKFDWTEDWFDYKKNLGIAASAIWGIKKCRFNSADYGIISIRTAAAAH